MPTTGWMLSGAGSLSGRPAAVVKPRKLDSAVIKGRVSMVTGEGCAQRIGLGGASKD